MKLGQEKFIELLNTTYKGRGELVNIITKVLNIAREPAYKRIRNEVPFSLDEVYLLIRELNLSADKIFGDEGNTSFQLTPSGDFKMDDAVEYYYQQIFQYNDLIEETIGDKPSYVLSAHSEFFPPQLLPYKYLSRFRAFLWLHQMTSSALDIGFSNIKIPEKYEDRLVFNGWKYPNRETAQIIDRRLVLKFIEQVNYMKSLEALSEDDITHIKEELLLCIQNVENIVMTGKGRYGSKGWFFLSDLDVRGECLYLKTVDIELAMIDIYHTQWGITKDPHTVRKHQLWMESLKKYSILLSASAEVTRCQFFSQQRKYIKEML